MVDLQLLLWSRHVADDSSYPACNVNVVVVVVVAAVVVAIIVMTVGEVVVLQVSKTAAGTSGTLVNYL